MRMRWGGCKGNKAFQEGSKSVNLSLEGVWDLYSRYIQRATSAGRGISIKASCVCYF